MGKRNGMSGDPEIQHKVEYLGNYSRSEWLEFKIREKQVVVVEFGLEDQTQVVVGVSCFLGKEA